MSFNSQLLNDLSEPTNSSSSNFSTTTLKSETPISLMSLRPELEPVIEIDADARKITVPDELYNIGVEGDHRAEKIFFTCPRYFDDNDLSQCNCVIRCINAGKEYCEFPTTDLEIDDDSIKFGWLIENPATRYKGEILFTVQFELTDDNSIDYQWQTTEAKLNVLPGISIGSTITSKDDLLFRRLSIQVEELQSEVNSLKLIIKQYEDSLHKIGALENKVNYLEDNVVYVLSS